MKIKKTVIPVFYAADENYLPYLAVSLTSLKENASRAYRYEIYVLTAGVSESAEGALKRLEDEDFTVACVNVSGKLEQVKNALQLRDYYTGATYYRIFIAGMFPQFDKAIYLDSDTVVLGDISELFNVELGANFVGAIPDGAVAAVPAFGVYTKQVLGIDAERYFNAGVLLMNLAQLRKENFYNRFCALLSVYKFRVAQDQDYLNVLCRGRVAFIGGEWNRMPVGGDEGETPKLVHYNLTLKPWHYPNILFEQYFWHYAKQTEDYGRILRDLNEYTDDKKQKDAESEKALVALCLEEAAQPDNFIRRFGNVAAKTQGFAGRGRVRF